MCTYTRQRSQGRFWPVLGLSRLISSYFLVKIKYKTQFDKRYQIQSSFILSLARCRCLIKTQKVLVSKCLYWKKMVKNLKCVVLLCPKIAGNYTRYFIFYTLFRNALAWFFVFSYIRGKKNIHSILILKLVKLVFMILFYLFFSSQNKTANICL